MKDKEARGSPWYRFDDEVSLKLQSIDVGSGHALFGSFVIEK